MLSACGTFCIQRWGLVSLSHSCYKHVDVHQKTWRIGLSQKAYELKHERLMYFCENQILRLIMNRKYVLSLDATDISGIYHAQNEGILNI